LVKALLLFLSFFLSTGYAMDLEELMRQSLKASLPIKWVRTPQGQPSSEVIDGICKLWFPDDPKGNINADLESLINACLKQGGLAEGVPEGSHRLNWYQIDDLASMWALNKEKHGWVKRNAPKGADLQGFHWEEGGQNHIATRNKRALGHEIKHIYDGKYHK
jgi:hypothetical protein